MKTCALLIAVTALVIAMMVYASPVETPDKGSPLRRAILDGFRASKEMQQLSQAWHAKVVFTDVNIRRSGDWAWVSATPMSEDSRNKVELNSGVLRKAAGQWAMVEFMPLGDVADEEFRFWRMQFMKKHPQCPAAIFPSQF
jgi:SnoaL-like protein